MNSGKLLLRVFLVVLLVGLTEVLVLFLKSPFQSDKKPDQPSKTVRNVKASNLSFTHTQDENSKHIEQFTSSNISTQDFDLQDQYLEMNASITEISESLTPISLIPYWNMTVVERHKFQQRQVKQFCHQYRYSISDSKQSQNLGRHMLLHVKAKTVFCFAPKVGCTNLKILFYLSQGVLPSSLLFKDNKDVNNSILEVAIKHHSFIGLSSTTREKILSTYYKFIMYRNPVERLLSAYRSKVEEIPLQGFLYDKPHYNWLKQRIFEYTHPKKYKKWMTKRGKAKISISFKDFVDYWLTGRLNGDEHFQTIFNLCQPCHVQYDYYGNFDTFERDAGVLIKHIKSDSIFLRDSYYKKGEQTSTVASRYYQQISERNKKLIVLKLARDLSFYYTIFPSQKDSHKTIMNINFDIPPVMY